MSVDVYRPWTPADKARLAQEYPTADIAALAVAMGRTDLSLKKMASRMDIRRVEPLCPRDREESALSRMFREWAPAFATPGAQLAWRV
ncbi:hypothetical protein [Pseudoxanthomonas koreensis]|uniref:hypothetical protein n=1 Tax=Pseudoxanthomonas koreensis TaxID=266061 RepID=UPI0013912B94|nr:hypothetical protein [Pseudoxanthomonas koreensis]KAF1692673.1 hypothetical protein CSC64_06710 [Pseudoxanthomonas koreensis]